MIYYVTLQEHAYTIRRLLPQLPRVQSLSYEELFHRRAAPIGHYIFTDIDRLTHYEQEVAVAIAEALRAARPEVRVLNDPRRVLERYPLLRRLEQEGLNTFAVTRIDDGSRPPRYPVFIRCEDDHRGPDTGLIYNDQEFDQALLELKARGRVLKRRIAVEYRAEKDREGMYRKYGCINIGGDLMPQHLFQSDGWMVKSASKHRTAEFAGEEMAFVRDNPHREHMARVFALAGIDFGRADYTVVNGRIEVYEINTNPNLPRLADRPGAESKAERREFFRTWMNQAFAALDTPVQPGPRVPFSLPQPQFHRMRTWTPEERTLLFRAWDWLVRKYPGLARRIPGRAWVRSLVRVVHSR